MTYEEAARILMKYAKTVNVVDLQTAIEMGADALFKRAVAEKAIDYSGFITYKVEYTDGNPDIELKETEDNAPMAE